MKKQLTTNTIALFLAVSLAACSGAKIEKAEVNPTPHDSGSGAGLFSGKSGNLLDAFTSKDKKSYIAAQAMPVNVYLWRASLDAISFMPLASASVQNGVIITDWYVNPNKNNERVKVNIYVLGKSFIPQNLKVSVFKQVKKSSGWVNVNENQNTASQLEDTILTNARALKVKIQASK